MSIPIEVTDSERKSAGERADVFKRNETDTRKKM